jgi:hypothetical protein
VRVSLIYVVVDFPQSFRGTSSRPEAVAHVQEFVLEYRP